MLLYSIFVDFCSGRDQEISDLYFWCDQCRMKFVCLAKCDCTNVM